MADETRKISLLVPVDFLKEMASLSEKVNAAETAEGKATIALEASPEQLKNLTELRRDMESYERSQVDEWHATTDRFMKISEMRISFYEKLILLAGGSFALSVTFLGSLQRHASQSPALTPLLAMGRLKAAWILLLVCIVLSWLQNLYRCAAVDNLTAITSTNVVARQRSWESRLATRAAGVFKGMESPPGGFGDLFSAVGRYLSGLSTKQQKDLPDYVKDLKRFSRVAAFIGALALLSIILAFAFMVVFAIKNAALL